MMHDNICQVDLQPILHRLNDFHFSIIDLEVVRMLRHKDVGYEIMKYYITKGHVRGVHN